MTDVILVDKNDHEIGVEEKIKAHELGKLHRAFSIFVFNSKKELMLQQRAKSKYHSGGLWSNTVCSHPRSGEDIKITVHKRLQEEMGFDCELKEIFSVRYNVKFSDGLSENEISHVFIGSFDDDPVMNPEEADDWQWITMEDLKKDIENNRGKYTLWFLEILPKMINYLKENPIKLSK